MDIEEFLDELIRTGIVVDISDGVQLTGRGVHV